MSMSADELLDKAVTCTTCGKLHQPVRQGSSSYWSWAGEDGHIYRTLLYAMTGESHSMAIEGLRRIAAGDA